MKDKLTKIYIYLVIVIGLINLSFGTLYLFFPSITVKALLYLATFIEFPLIILSIIMLFHVFSKKLNKINLILPAIYLASYLSLGIFGGIIFARGIDPLDLTYFPNIIGYIISIISYIFQIIFGIYLLKRK